MTVAVDTRPWRGGGSRRSPDTHRPNSFAGCGWKRAADVLREAPGSIGEVAYAVGFKSPSHFTVAFKKAFGVTPSRFADGETSKT